MVRVLISGLGKTGKEIAKVVLEHDDIKLVSAICSPGSEKAGQDLGEFLNCKKAGILIESSEHLEEIIFRTKPDVVIDFSNPGAAMKNARVFSKLKVNILLGTTGFTAWQQKKLFVLTKKYRNGIVYAPNITLGVNVLMLLANLTANILNTYDFQITEIHHKYKKDAPSGTAKKIALEIEKGLNAAGTPSSSSPIPISAIRAGGVVGKHEVMIVGEDDKIEISHESFSRRAFALGAIRAVHFIKDKSGYFEMRDVLHLDKALSDYLEKEHSTFKKRYSRYGSDKHHTAQYR